MSNLLTTAEGVLAMREACREQIKHRMSRFFHRTLVPEWLNFNLTGQQEFSITNVLGLLNENHDPEIISLVQLLSTLGGFPVSISDQDIYINKNGSDETGIGTADQPYETPLTAINNLPAILDHDYRIILQHDGLAGVTVYENTDVLISTVLRKGTLTIVGEGDVIVARTGDTLTGSVDVGTAAGKRFTVAGAGWGVNAYQGMWIRPTNGANQDEAIPILKNNAVEIWTRYQTNSPAIGDDFDIVRPSVVWKLNSLTLDLTNQNRRTFTGHGRFMMANLMLDLSGTTTAADTLTMIGVQSKLWLDFVKIVLADFGFFDIKTDGVGINSTVPYENAVSALTGINFANWADNTQSTETPGFTVLRLTPGLADNYQLETIKSVILGLTCSEGVSMNETTIDGSAVGQVSNSGIHTGNLLRTVLVNGNGANPVWFIRSDVNLQNVHIMNSTGDAVTVEGGFVRFNADVSCDVVNVAGFALSAGPLCHGQIEQDGASFAGAGGDINFTSPAPDLPFVWPAAGASQTDGNGSYVVRPG